MEGKRASRGKRMRAAGEMVADTKPKSGIGRTKLKSGNGRTLRDVVAMKKLKAMIKRKAMKELKAMQELKECSLNDNELRGMFDEWAKKKKKVYKDREEREERYAIWSATRKRVLKSNAASPYGPALKVVLNEYADRRFSEKSFGCIPSRPKVIPKPEKFEMSPDQLKEEMTEFDKWAAKYGKVYISKEDRENRFWIYMNRKKALNEFSKDKSGLFKSDGYGVRMDRYIWEMPFVRNDGRDITSCSSSCCSSSA